MKKTFGLISLIFLVTISASSAKSIDLDGSIILRDGSKVVRIDVGNEDKRGNGRSINKRIKRLERAVRALQNRVYELEDQETSESEIKVLLQIRFLSRDYFRTYSIIPGRTAPFSKCGGAIL